MIFAQSAEPIMSVLIPKQLKAVDLVQGLCSKCIELRRSLLNQIKPKWVVFFNMEILVVDRAPF